MYSEPDNADRHCCILNQEIDEEGEITKDRSLDKKKENEIWKEHILLICKMICNAILCYYKLLWFFYCKNRYKYLVQLAFYALEDKVQQIYKKLNMMSKKYSYCKSNLCFVNGSFQAIFALKNRFC